MNIDVCSTCVFCEVITSICGAYNYISCRWKGDCSNNCPPYHPHYKSNDRDRYQYDKVKFIEWVTKEEMTI